MNLTNHLARGILVAALASAAVVGTGGTSRADKAAATSAPTLSTATAAAAAYAPNPDDAPMAAVTAPRAPQSPTATPRNTAVRLTWLAPSSNGGAKINTYRVQRATSKSGPWKTIAKPTVRRYRATGLTNGKRYYFRIAARNAVGWSKPSKIVSGVPRTVPTAPRSLVATPGNATVKVTWQAPSSNGGATIDKYRVQRTFAGSAWTTIAEPTTRSYSAGALVNGTAYSFRVAAHNRSGWSPASTVVTTVPRTVPTAPQSPTATAGLYSVYLTWQKPASTGGAAIKYIIEHHLANETEWKVLGETTASVLSYKAAGLTEIGTQYFFRIRAHNAAGSGAGSAVVFALPLTEPTQPQGPTATLDSGTVALKWYAPWHDGGTPINKYIVQQAINQGPFTTIAYPTTTSHTVTELKPGNTYRFQILAQNDAGTSAPSDIRSVTIPPTVPSAPSFCSAFQWGGNGSDTMRIEWGPPTNNGGAPILFHTIVIYDHYNASKVWTTWVWGPTWTHDEILPVGHYYDLTITPYNKVGPGPFCEVGMRYLYP